AARYGGEEFAVILPNTHADGARRVAEDIRERLRDTGIPHKASVAGEVVTLSFGIGSVVPQRTGTVADLVSLADQALYKAKAAGRNRVVVA
ncbi:MAG: GGDEF domain-containing protein, partial [Desulfobacterales bacterium]|nr:GGDEF domain-containing protein [Desulfobacterales bacterium]